MIDHLVVLSIPGLRPVDIHDSYLTPTLYHLARAGATGVIVPTFPCVGPSAQASMLTGAAPAEHGIVVSGVFDPGFSTAEPGFDRWTGSHENLQRPAIFDLLRQHRPDATSASWFASNARGGSATWTISAAAPDPAEEELPGCSVETRGNPFDPAGGLGTFPGRSHWGPDPGRAAMKWTLEGMLALARTDAPTLQFACIPHLAHTATVHGPHSHELAEAMAELDAAIGDLLGAWNELPIARTTAWLIVGEHALTPVDGVVYPNRVLRDAGLLTVRHREEGERIDPSAGGALALVDHQVAHLFIAPGASADAYDVASLFRRDERIADIVVGPERRAVGMDHPRCGDVILIARPDTWFAYGWWADERLAPRGARRIGWTGKLGADPLELVADRWIAQVPLDAERIKGSFGAPATDTAQHTLLIASRPALLEGLPSPTRDRDVFAIMRKALALP